MYTILTCSVYSPLFMPLLIILSKYRSYISGIKIAQKLQLKYCRRVVSMLGYKLNLLACDCRGKSIENSLSCLRLFLVAIKFIGVELSIMRSVRPVHIV